ncbi:MAG: 50S ribosomal protein L29 [Thermoguttaceae bacterium]|nr:50S ribosomal protein L29 [Thermoguttaceae bacterium]
MAKAIKASELRGMSDEQLALTLQEARTTLFKLRVQASTERLDTVSNLRVNRKLIARVLTIQRERALQQKAEQVAVQANTGA